jgi:hypothetical protein
MSRGRACRAEGVSFLFFPFSLSFFFFFFVVGGNALCGFVFLGWGKGREREGGTDFFWRRHFGFDPFCVSLLDLHMNGLDGFSFRRRRREEG